MCFALKSFRLFQPASRVLLGVALLFPFKSLEAKQSIEQIPQPEFFDPMDSSREYMSAKFVNFVDHIDNFFGDERVYQEGNKSVLQMELTRVIGLGSDRKFLLSGRAKFHLPISEQRLNLLLEANADDKTNGEQTPVKATPVKQVAVPKSYSVAARIEKSKEGVWHSSADAGLRFQGLNTNFFARARGSYAIPLEQWRLKAAETLFWYKETGAGATTQFDAERPISELMMFRASSTAAWLTDYLNFDLHQDLSVYHALDERTALLYQVSATGISQPHLLVTDYAVLVNYRYRLHRDWMFYELSPQLHFPEGRNYRVTPFLGFRLEVLFSNSN